jgi:hypothetical protein
MISDKEHERVIAEKDRYAANLQAAIGALSEEIESLQAQVAMIREMVRQAISLRESLCKSRSQNPEHDGYLCNWRDALSATPSTWLTEHDAKILEEVAMQIGDGIDSYCVTAAKREIRRIAAQRKEKP